MRRGGCTASLRSRGTQRRKTCSGFLSSSGSNFFKPATRTSERSRASTRSSTTTASRLLTPLGLREGFGRSVDEPAISLPTVKPAAFRRRRGEVLSSTNLDVGFGLARARCEFKTTTKIVACRSRKPTPNAREATHTADHSTALNRCVLVAAKGTEASNLAKVNLAPFHAGGSVVERPKPFNTWVLPDPLEDTVEFVQGRVLDFKTTSAILLVLDPYFGA